MADYADCLFGFVTALGLTRPYVAGLSFGGALALELFRRHPACRGNSSWRAPMRAGRVRSP